MLLKLKILMYFLQCFYKNDCDKKFNFGQLLLDLKCVTKAKWSDFIQSNSIETKNQIYLFLKTLTSWKYFFIIIKNDNTFYILSKLHICARSFFFPSQ